MIVLYARKSDSPDADTSPSVERQLEDMRAYCSSKGHLVRAEFHDQGISGAELDRPGLWDAIHALRRGDILLVRSYDRIARDVTVVAATVIRTIEKKGCALWSMTEGGELAHSPVGQMVRTMLLAVAQCQRQMNNARTRARMRSHQANGRAMSCIAPYGWRHGPTQEIRTPDGNVTYRQTLEQEPDEQAVIEKIKAYHASGVPLRKICRLLHEAGLSCRGGNFHHGTIRAVLARAGLVELRPTPKRKPKLTME